MRNWRGLVVGGSAVALTLAMVGAAIAGTVSGTLTTGGTVTLSFPSYPLTGPALESCEPWEEATANTVTLSGVPEGATVTLTFLWSNPYAGTPSYLPPVTYTNVTGGELVAPVSYPMDSSQWPLWNTATNERAIGIAVQVRIISQAGVQIGKVVSKQWWIRCLPPQNPAQGCTPGFWRQEHHYDSWVGYTPTDDFETVFGVDASFSPDSLGDAVELGGGGERALARHAVAALLNAATGDVNYTLSISQVIASVQNAYATGEFEALKDQLDAANNAGCPLN